MAAEGVALRARGDAAPDRARARAWQRWLAAAGPWALWSICPALQAPTSIVSARIVDDGISPSVVEELSPTLSGGGTLVLLDVAPVLGVRIAARLSETRFAHVVLVLPRWPYAEAVLPTFELTRALIDESARLTRTLRSSNVVFVIDAERAKPARRHAARQADNRYRLSPADLPNLAILRAHGIRRIVKVS